MQQTANSRQSTPEEAVVCSIAPARQLSAFENAFDHVRRHWPEYLMEAGELGAFMMSACVFGALLGHPDSPIVKAVPTDWMRRVMMGIAMGLTSICIVYSPWGKQSGAHMNPSVTFTFFRLGKIAPWDLFFYVVSQFSGGILGVFLVAQFLGATIAHPAVHYVVTIPGEHGTLPALIAEFMLAFVLMTCILILTNSHKFDPYTGVIVGAIVATYIAVESPISGMSMNPARTTASAVGANLWTAAWIYFTGPPAGMLMAAEAYLWLKQGGVACAKLQHNNNKRCIFCEFQQLKLKLAQQV